MWTVRDGDGRVNISFKRRGHLMPRRCCKGNNKKDGSAADKESPGPCKHEAAQKQPYSGRAVMLFMKQNNEENNRRLGSRMLSTG